MGDGVAAELDGGARKVSAFIHSFNNPGSVDGAECAVYAGRYSLLHNGVSQGIAHGVTFTFELE